MVDIYEKGKNSKKLALKVFIKYIGWAGLVRDVLLSSVLTLFNS